jgi:hypothetical protein
MSNLIIPQDIRKLSRQRAPRFHRILKTPPPDQIEVGQIWSTHSCLELSDDRHIEADEPRLVVILDGTGHPSESLDQITAAPVSLSIPMAAEFDLVVSGDASPLGFDFIIEVWNETPVVKGHLRQFLGKLSAEAIAALRGLYTAQLLNEDVPPTLAEWVGLRIMGENDPRLAFQEAEVETVSYLARTATAALLEMTVQEPESVAVIPIKPRWVFSLRPRLAKLSEALGSPKVAYAAGVAEEVDTYIVDQTGDDLVFSFELLFRQRRPYTIYLKVHRISSKLEGHRCVVTINATAGEWQSVPTELRTGAQILVGEDCSFRIDQVEMVKVEIE